MNGGVSPSGRVPVHSWHLGAEVSVRAVLALWDSVRRRGADPARLADGTGYSIARLTDPKERISWDGYCRLMSNLGAMFDDAELEAIGGEVIDSPFFRAFVVPMRYLFGATDVYRWLCGPQSPAQKMFSQAEGHVVDAGASRVRIEYTNRPGYESSRENFLVLKGTLIGLGTAVSGQRARATMQTTSTGVSFTIELAEQQGLFAVARRRARASLHRLARVPKATERDLDLEREANARIATENELRRSEERYRELFERAPVPMWVFDAETLRFLDVNAAAVSHYGYSRAEFLSMTILDLRPAEDTGEVSHLKEHVDAPRIWRHRKRDGSIILAEITAHTVSVQGRRARLVHATDVTARQHLHEQLGEARRMRAVGELARGIAHDFNNLLAVIIATSDIALRATDIPERTTEDIQAILSAAHRGADLSRRLMSFGKSQLASSRLVDVGDVLRDMQPLLTRAVHERIRVVIRAPQPVNVTCVDRAGLERTIMNLVVNARDAMPDGGTVSVSVSLVELDARAAAAHGGKNPGAFAVLSVADTGVGMDSETLGRIFERDFTTKPAGRGTGLGLANVWSIVEEAGGHIRVESTVGQGTRFELYLPVAKVDLDAPVEI